MRVLRDYGANVSLPDEKLITWPFYSVQEDRVVWIWRNYAWEQGSNGMCAGNTPAEALVQGLSEIFERYAIQEVLAGNIIPPDIPPEGIAPPIIPVPDILSPIIPNILLDVEVTLSC